MKPVLIYLHGYGSSGTSETATGLRRLLENEFEIITPTYNGANPIEAAMTLDDAVGSAPSDRVVIAGTSLGGFFANYLARKHGLPAVMVNPTLKPSESLAEFHKAQPILDAYIRLEAEEKEFTAMPPREVVVGLNDEVVNPAEHGLTLKNVADILEIPMGHRVEPEFYGVIAKVIQELTNKARAAAPPEQLEQGQTS